MIQCACTGIIEIRPRSLVSPSISTAAGFLQPRWCAHRAVNFRAVSVPDRHEPSKLFPTESKIVAEALASSLMSMTRDACFTSD